MPQGCSIRNATVQLVALICVGHACAAPLDGYAPESSGARSEETRVTTAGQSTRAEVGIVHLLNEPPGQYRTGSDKIAAKVLVELAALGVPSVAVGPWVGTEPLPELDFRYIPIRYANGTSTHAGAEVQLDFDFAFPFFSTHPLSPTQRFGHLGTTELARMVDVMRERTRTAVFEVARELEKNGGGTVVLRAMHTGVTTAAAEEVLSDPAVHAELPPGVVLSDTLYVHLHGNEATAMAETSPEWGPWQQLAVGTMRSRRIRVVTADSSLLAMPAMRYFRIAPKAVHALWPGLSPEFFPLPDLILGAGASRDEGAVLSRRRQVLDSLGLTHVPANARIVAFVGRMEAHKGVGTLIKSEPKYRAAAFARGVAVHTVLVGDGAQREQYVALSNAQGGSEYVHFIRALSPSQINSLLGLAATAPVPSEGYEGFPLVFAEAMGTGTPPIITDRVARPNDLPHDLLNDRLVVFVPRRNAQALAETISDVILAHRKTPATARRLAAFAGQALNWRSHAEKLLRLIDRRAVALAGR